MTSFSKALITGASSGIGEALCHLLAQKKIPLILHGRNQEKLEKLAKEVSAKEIIVADLRKKENRQKILEAISVEFPDLIINNAGYAVYGDVLSTSLKEQIDIMDVNAKAPLEFSIEAARALIARGKNGVILNVSSMAGEFPTPGMTVYGASKAFLTQFSSAFHTETAPYGVDVLVSCPGMVSSEFATRAARKNMIIKGPQVTPECAAKEIWKQIEKRKEKQIFSATYRIIKRLSLLTPLSWIKMKIYRSIKERL